MSKRTKSKSPEGKRATMPKVHVLGGMFDDELSKIPKHMHRKLAQLIHRNVENRVREYMSQFRDDVF